mgnify:CR=1 FL=1
MARRICVVTGSRAEYGLLYWVMRAIVADPALELQVVATGMHLSPEFGMTVDRIEADGFVVDARVDMLLSADSRIAVAKSMGLATISFADAFAQLAPDIVLVLGDRFEILAASQAAYLTGYPIAHLCGGDVTEGVFDEAIRHTITKMASLHFVTQQESWNRVRQLGENPAHIHLAGNPGLDFIRQAEWLDRADIERRLGLSLRSRNVLVTFHPETLADRSSVDAQAEMLDALARMPELGIVITRPNADPEGRALIKALDAFAAGRDNVVVHTSLGQQLFCNVLRVVDAMVGNSSSGIMEAPAMGRPTVNIGDRQRGRPRSRSVIDVAGGTDAIETAIRQALARPPGQTDPLYGDGNAAPRIAGVLRDIADLSDLRRKPFYDLQVGIDPGA